MRIQTRLLMLLLVVAVVPVTISGLTAVFLSQKVLERNIEARNVTEARYLADRVDGYLSEALRDLRLAVGYMPFSDLTPDESVGALGMVYRQHEGFNIVSLIDNEDTAVTEPIFSEDPKQEAWASGHHRVTERDLGVFTRNVPLEATRAAGAALGPVYLSPDKQIPVLVLAAANVESGSQAPMVLAVELALDSLVRWAEELAAETHSAVYVVDDRGRVVAHSLREVSVTQASFANRDPVREVNGTSLESHGMVHYSAGNVPLAAAYSRLARWPWGVVVERPKAEVYAPVRRIAMQTAFWVVVALVCAFAAGVLSSRSISDPIRALARAAAALKEGDLDVRARVEGRDEIAGLATTFNDMASAIQLRDEELRAFAEDLQARVEERTRELRLAQDQLLRSEKLAAVGELGAGVAHEINNPLAGVLGSAQLLLLRTNLEEDDAEHLKNIETEALRIREIVKNLLQLSQSREKQTGVLLDINRVLEAALSLVARPIIAQRIRVTKDLTREIPKVRGDPGDLQQVFLHLLSNAKNAMPNGGALEISTGVVENRLVKVTVTDTGVGIPEDDLERIFEPFFTRKASWEGKGLGLSVVHQTVEQLGGRITVESKLGEGTSFHIVFPIVRDSLHLA